MAGFPRNKLINVVMVPKGIKTPFGVGIYAKDDFYTIFINVIDNCKSYGISMHNDYTDETISKLVLPEKGRNVSTDWFRLNGEDFKVIMYRDEINYNIIEIRRK